MFEEFFERLTPQQQEEHMAKFPIGLPTPEQVSGAYVFMVSALSDGMTAQSLNVDGGYTL
jgi:hypothetical protein